MNKKWKIGECDGCNLEVKVRKWELGYPEKEYFLCEVCSETQLGNEVAYQHTSDYHILFSLSVVANLIFRRLDEIEKLIKN